MKFSLILPTLGRSTEIEYCLESIENQSFSEYEVIIIDQNKDYRTRDIVEKFKNVIYKYTEIKGLSRARNIGLQAASGDYFCLIDDDAYYSPDYLEKLRLRIAENPHDTIISGYAWDSVRNMPFADYEEIKRNYPLSIRAIMRYCPSPCITFPMSCIQKVGLFDEEFGVGAKYGAGEETDYLLRCIDKGYKVAYFDDVKIIHPHEKLANKLQNGKEFDKAKRYAYGVGAMVKKNILHGSQKTPIRIYHAELLFKRIAKCLLRRANSYEELKSYLEGYYDYKG